MGAGGRCEESHEANLVLKEPASSQPKAVLQGVASVQRSDQLLDFTVIADEEEDQFGRGDDEHECQALIETKPAFIDGFRQTTDAQTGVDVGLAPSGLHGVHDLADDLALLLGSEAKLAKQVISDPYVQ